MTSKKSILLDVKGLTMVELMITTVILAVVLAVVNGIFFSSNEMYAKTNRRAGIQSNTRLGMSIMTKEIRHTGLDPLDAGINGLMAAKADTIRCIADMNADGAIQTAEPSEDVTYFYDAVAQAVMRDPGAGPQVIVPNVTAMNFAYLDGANNPLLPLPLTPAQTSQVRSVAISMTSQARDVGDVTITTTIALRNP